MTAYRAKPRGVFRLTCERTLVLDLDASDGAEPPGGKLAVETLVSAISPGTELAAWVVAPPLRPTTQPYPRLMGYCNVCIVRAPGVGAGQLPDGSAIGLSTRVLTPQLIAATM